MGVAASASRCLCCLHLLPCLIEDVASNEVHEGWREGHDQGCFVEGDRHGAWLENEGLLQRAEQPCDGCYKRGEKDWRVHSPRSMPHQDQDKASHEGMREGHLWQGAKGEGKASEDGCESLPSCCPQETDLGECRVIVCGTLQGSCCGNPTGCTFEVPFWQLTTRT